MGLHRKHFDLGSQSPLSAELGSLDTADRVHQLRAWLALHGVTYADLARILGCSKQLISRIARSNRASAHRIEQLVALGVPRELLPEPIVRGSSARDE